MLRGKFIALNVYVRKEEMSKNKTRVPSQETSEKGKIKLISKHGNDVQFYIQ